MNKVINGFDLDGTVSIGIYPGPDDVIITGRSFEEQEYTQEWLKSRGINNLVYYSPHQYNFKSRAKSAEHKINTIKRLKDKGLIIENFFEDDPAQFEIMEKELRTVRFIRIVQKHITLENVWRGEDNIDY